MNLNSRIEHILSVLMVFVLFLSPLLSEAAGVVGQYHSGGSIPKVVNPGKMLRNTAIPGLYRPSGRSPAGNTLPELRNIERGVGEIEREGNTMTIHQSEKRAVINWDSFNVGADATVRFTQDKGSWAALNRIWDMNPSYIMGKLKADGKIFLINQNGILFGPGSKVNTGGLVASALNIKDDDFIKNVLKFSQEEGASDPGLSADLNAVVTNQGQIETGEGGQVFLIGPNVENTPVPDVSRENKSGKIDTPSGQIGLISGMKVELTKNPDDPSIYDVIVYDAGSGNALNQGYIQIIDDKPVLFSGQLNADGGKVGMYGDTVEQWGVIRSMTAFKNKNGQVELKAASRVETGPDSLISLPVNPSKTETVSDTFDIKSRVRIQGLDKLTSLGKLKETLVGEINLEGSITAPIGSVALKAERGVTMEPGSLIDVSGVVTTMPAALLRDVKLNSVELRDTYGQKRGIIPGQKITTPVISDSSIGNLSGNYLSHEQTALERSIGGAVNTVLEAEQTGRIDITVNDGEIIVKNGALIDFSGGAVHYEEGFVTTTRLLSGMKIFDYRNAPTDRTYDDVLGRHDRIYERYGIRESYSGIYYGGSAPLDTYVPGYTKGGDAGTLALNARSIVLDGRLDGSVVRGTFQNLVTKDTSSEEYAVSVLRGLEEPRSGRLIIGAPDNYFESPVQPDSISIISGTASGFSDDPGVVLLSSDILNDAKLDTIQLTALQTIRTEPGAVISLEAGGTFDAMGRRIEHMGEIDVPSGTISLTLSENRTSLSDGAGSLRDTTDGYVSIRERIVLGDESRLDVSGQRADNSILANESGRATARNGRIDGGNISIRDVTDQGTGVFISDGALLDVSGGAAIDITGTVSGGNAGSLLLQGTNIMLDGDLMGYALADEKGEIRGGSVTLHTNSISVGVEGSDWSGFDPLTGDIFGDSRDGRLVIAGNRFSDTGFTNITLNSLNDIAMDPNTVLTTSLVRLNPETLLNSAVSPGRQGESSLGNVPAGLPDLLRLNDSSAYMAGKSSVEARAGVDYPESQESGYSNHLKKRNPADPAIVVVAPGSEIRTSPGGNITLSTSSLDTDTPLVIAGILDSAGGKIRIDSGSSDLVVESTGKILASGYTIPDFISTPSGYDVNKRAMSAGSVSLESGKNMVIKEGSLIDIAGSESVENRIRQGNGELATFREAGNPGTLSLGFFEDLTWDGSVDTSVKMDGVRGASLSLVRRSETGGLSVLTEDLLRYRELGFDDLTLRSKRSLGFSLSGNNTVAFGRRLTLDAPEVVSIGMDSDATLLLEAPWVTLGSTYFGQNREQGEGSQTHPQAVNNTLSLSGEWIDVIGQIKVSGFKNLALQAGQDIRLNEVFFSTEEEGSKLKNSLSTNGDLTLDARRIYPGNFYKEDVVVPDIYSDYTLSARGTVTVKGPGGRSGGPVYSAGGSITVEAGRGANMQSGSSLVAPMGSITLRTVTYPAQGDAVTIQEGTTDRIFLADGSMLTTVGSADVQYNAINLNNLWVAEDKNKTPGSVDSNNSTITFFDQSSLPSKGVLLQASETVVADGAEINVSAGGGFFGYRFEPGVEGSVNPLEISGRYIVFKDNQLSAPGTSLYLEGGGGLAAGEYTLLPLGRGFEHNARYAFMPGAFILEQQPGGPLPENGDVTKLGYPLIAGYRGVADTEIRNTRPGVFSVRTAADVITEGHFEIRSLNAGNAGDLNIKGNTTIIDGALRAEAEKGFRGGKLTLSGRDIFVRETGGALLTDGFDYNVAFDSSATLQELEGKLTVDPDALSGNGFREINLGYLNREDINDGLNTESITVENGSVIEAPVISLSADSLISIGESVELHATTSQDASGGEGVLRLDTPGSLSVMKGGLLHASHNIDLNVENDYNFLGSLKVDNSSITLRGRTIYFTEEDKGPSDVGLFLNNRLWEMFTQFEDIKLSAGYTVYNSNGKREHVSTDIRFVDSYDLSAAGSITLDAAGIVGDSDLVDVSLSAPGVKFQNSGRAEPEPFLAEQSTGRFTINNADRIEIGDGEISFDGFSSIGLNSSGDVAFRGAGALVTGNADLDIRAAGVTAVEGGLAGEGREPADFRVVAGAFRDDLNPGGTITMTRSESGLAPTGSVPGGVLNFSARKIEIMTALEVAGGTIRFTTAGARDDAGVLLPYSEDENGNFTDGIVVGDGGTVSVSGTGLARGGRVILETGFASETGPVNGGGKIYLEEGSIIDVSAGYSMQQDGSMASRGDAGKVILSGATEGVVISGLLKGGAIDQTDSDGQITRRGRGGSLTLDTHSFSDEGTDLSALIMNLERGGFTESVDLRSRSGEIKIEANQTLSAGHIRLTADKSVGRAENDILDGRIDILGTIDASAGVTGADDGGTVEIYSAEELNIPAGGIIRATGTDRGEGGNVLLSSSEGWIRFAQGGKVDVSGGRDGTVYLRAERNGNDVKIDPGFNTIIGASTVFAEAVRRYSFDQPDLDVSSFYQTWLDDASNFYNNVSLDVTALLEAAAPGGPLTFHLLPGIEVVNSGNLTTGSEIDLSPEKTNTRYQTPYDLNAGRAVKEPGVLTLRAGGDLKIKNNLVDHPTPISELPGVQGRDSWGFNLVAGSDRKSSDFLSVLSGKGDLNLMKNPGNPNSAGSLVYTESAPIRFASGRNTLIGEGVKAGGRENGTTSRSSRGGRSGRGGSGGQSENVPGGYMISENMYYNLASYDGDIEGNVGQDMIITAGAIQTATGNISVSTGRDLRLESGVKPYSGAIRTTGQAPVVYDVEENRYSYADIPMGEHPSDPDGIPVILAARGGKRITDKRAYYWRYGDGGDILLDVGRNVQSKRGFSGTSAWDYYTAIERPGAPVSSRDKKRQDYYGWFSASYERLGSSVTLSGSEEFDTTSGLATMGGGNLTVRSGGEFRTSVGTFGKGNLQVDSGGDIFGRFLNNEGFANIHAMGNFGSADIPQQVELSDSQVLLTASGDIEIGNIVNPTLVSSQLNQNHWVNNTYTEDSSIRIVAGGNVTIGNETRIDGDFGGILPPDVDIEAGGDLNFQSKYLTMASSPKGNLRLVAGGNIIQTPVNSIFGRSAGIQMSDIAPEYWYGLFRVFDGGDGGGKNWLTPRSLHNYHGYFAAGDGAKQAAASSLHIGDDRAIEIRAGGDIKGLGLYTAKQAEIRSGGDILDFVYEGQNISPDDVSIIRAGGDIRMQYGKSSSAGGLIQGGPGVFIVQAGNSIDLGSSNNVLDPTTGEITYGGVQAVGNGSNILLGTEKSTLAVLSGYAQDLNSEVISTFFNEIRDAGDLYSYLLGGGATREDVDTLITKIAERNVPISENGTGSEKSQFAALSGSAGVQASFIENLRNVAATEEDFYAMFSDGGHKTEAGEFLRLVRANGIEPLFGEPSGQGDINMIASQIGTSIGQSDIFVISAGGVDLGQTSLPVWGEESNDFTGVWTGGGGSINLFAMGDVNVNESRIMTFSGGDVSVWSNEGSINAGRGASSAVSARPSRKQETAPGSGVFVDVFSPPAAGSGIRSLTFDPDGPGPLSEPDPGDIHLFAPNGIIDAGEAGISGGRIIVAAARVENAGNIKSSAGSVGIPQASGASSDLGVLSGAGGAVSETGKSITSSASGVATQRTRNVGKMIDDVMLKWLNVRVVNFVQYDDYKFSSDEEVEKTSENEI